MTDRASALRPVECPIVFLNGAYLPAGEARISVFDRGFLYGDTIYEVFRTTEGLPIFLEEHRQRFRRSAELAAFPSGWERYDLAAVTSGLLRRCDLTEARVRVTVSRGLDGPEGEGDPTWVASAVAFAGYPAEWYEQGVRAALVTVSRQAAGTLSPEIKSGNLLSMQLARREAHRAGAVEGIMLNQAGRVAEGTMSTVFWVRDGVLRTPALAVGILPGVTRAKVLEIARAGPAGLLPESAAGRTAGGGGTIRSVEEVQTGPEELAEADELFLTSTSFEVLPVTSLGERPVGTGRPGPVAADLRRRLRALYPSRR